MTYSLYVEIDTNDADYAGKLTTNLSAEEIQEFREAYSAWSNACESEEQKDIIMNYVSVGSWFEDWFDGELPFSAISDVKIIKTNYIEIL